MTRKGGGRESVVVPGGSPNQVPVGGQSESGVRPAANPAASGASVAPVPPRFGYWRKGYWYEVAQLANERIRALEAELARFHIAYDDAFARAEKAEARVKELLLENEALHAALKELSTSLDEAKEANWSLAKERDE